MPTQDLDAVEARLQTMLDRYRPELVDGTIYGVPALVWPEATGHDDFVATKRGAKGVSLYLIIADRYPEQLVTATDELRERGRGRATHAFASLDEGLASDVAAFLDRLLVHYRAEHTDPAGKDVTNGLL